MNKLFFVSKSKELPLKKGFNFLYKLNRKNDEPLYVFERNKTLNCFSKEEKAEIGFTNKFFFNTVPDYSHINRMKEELSELESRIKKLDKYIGENDIPKDKRKLMIKQLYTMIDYSDILNERICIEESE